MKRSLIGAVVLLLFIASLVPAMAAPTCKGGVCTLTAKSTPIRTGVCPVLGKKIADVSKAPKSVYNGKTYYFCCKNCKTKFDKDPARYVKPGPARKVISAVCPVMGTRIADVTKAAGKSVYKGKTYYFCCPMCKPMFDKNPEKYLHKKK